MEAKKERLWKFTIRGKEIDCGALLNIVEHLVVVNEDRSIEVCNTVYGEPVYMDISKLDSWDRQEYDYIKEYLETHYSSDPGLYSFEIYVEENYYGDYWFYLENVKKIDLRLAMEYK